MRLGNVSKSPHRRWAEFRLSVVGGLLATPPGTQELKEEIEKLALKPWTHPIKGKPIKFGFSTIEGWYYTARKERDDPLAKLQSKVRSDAGKSRTITGEVEALLVKQYEAYPYWNYRLHADNLRVAVAKALKNVEPPTYDPVLRYMKANGLTKKKRRRDDDRPGAVATAAKLALRETRSWETEFVNSLWHLDFHHGSLKVLCENGQWRLPILLGIFDDHSRLACHMQWYLAETAENLVHGVSQAFQKRGLTREMLNDNGAAMTSREFTSGLTALSILAKTTLPYSPQMNGKCEFVWSRVESRLMPMLSGQKDLTLKMLNDATQAWAEIEYNQVVHRETRERPLDRFMKGKDVGRPCPSSETLRMAFRAEVRRTQRRSDGTITIEGRRFEIPSRFRCLEQITVRFARWDLGFVHMIDERTGAPLSRIYPIDKLANADGRRRLLEDPAPGAAPVTSNELPPLMDKLMQDYSALGLLPAYVTKNKMMKTNEGDSDARG